MWVLIRSMLAASRSPATPSRSRSASTTFWTDRYHPNLLVNAVAIELGR
jgi:hypothetical protein